MVSHTAGVAGVYTQGRGLWSGLTEGAGRLLELKYALGSWCHAEVKGLFVDEGKTSGLAAFAGLAAAASLGNTA